MQQRSHTHLMDRAETLSIRRYVAAVSALPLVQSYAYGRRVPHTRLMLLLLLERDWRGLVAPGAWAVARYFTRWIIVGRPSCVQPLRYAVPKRSGTDRATVEIEKEKKTPSVSWLMVGPLRTELYGYRWGKHTATTHGPPHALVHTDPSPLLFFFSFLVFFPPPMRSW